MDHFSFPDPFHGENEPSASSSISISSTSSPITKGVPYLASGTPLYSYAAAPSTQPAEATTSTSATGLAGTGSLSIIDAIYSGHPNTRGPSSIPDSSVAPTLRHRKRASVPRSRNGCWTCRLRRKKCPEEHPVCSTCSRLSLTCHGYGERPEFMKSPEAMDLMRKLIGQEIHACKPRCQDSVTRSPMIPEPQLSEFDGTPPPSLGSSEVQGVSTTSSSPTMDHFNSQTAQVKYLPTYLEIDIDSLDSRPLALLSHHVDEVPLAILDPTIDIPTQLFHAVVYFRMASRLLFPAIFLQDDYRSHFQVLVYECVVRDKYLWRSICEIASIYISVVKNEYAQSRNLSFLQSAISIVDNEVAVLLSSIPSNPPEEELTSTIFLAWNTFTVNRLLGFTDTRSLTSIQKLVRHFGLLSPTTVKSSTLLRVIVGHALYADVILSTATSAPPILASTYSHMLNTYMHGGEIFRTGSDTGVPVVTTLILLLSRVIELKRSLTPSTELVMQVESVICALDTFVIDPDVPRDTIWRCSELFRLAVRVYLVCFAAEDTFKNIRESSHVKESAGQYCALLATEFSERSRVDPGSDMPGSVYQQELERTIVWTLVVVGSVVSSKLSVEIGSGEEKSRVACRTIIRNVFERSVWLKRFGSWGSAWRVVKTAWSEPKWSNGVSWQDIIPDAHVLL